MTLKFKAWRTPVATPVLQYQGWPWKSVSKLDQIFLIQCLPFFISLYYFYEFLKAFQVEFLASLSQKPTLPVLGWYIIAWCVWDLVSLTSIHSALRIIVRLCFNVTLDLLQHMHTDVLYDPYVDSKSKPTWVPLSASHFCGPFSWEFCSMNTTRRWILVNHSRSRVTTQHSLPTGLTCLSSLLSAPTTLTWTTPALTCSRILQLSFLQHIICFSTCPMARSLSMRISV